ncbi:preprotein translocase subunit SecG [Alphaproteobacteria bacterium KMM 3653]|uniref:Protein-export membrane protein SecG n=1 Tax=Harenicola maris TaxID=2841044 RepID=A0AAP2CPD3_9RHOB|nr:preprotein translocase subunit SecG [Harenicola maris]
MQNVLLIVHLIIALCLIGVVLLQRSEGGMGLGGGGGGGGVMSGRAAATAMGKLTWFFAIAFLCTSIALGILNIADSSNSSVIDRLGADTEDGTDGSLLPPGESLLPPSATDEPLVPQAAD